MPLRWDVVRSLLSSDADCNQWFECFSARASTTSIDLSFQALRVKAMLSMSVQFAHESRIGDIYSVHVNLRPSSLRLGKVQVSEK